MRKNLTIGEIFVYYDEPLIFALKDEYGGNFIGSMAEPGNASGFEYAAFPITPGLLVAFSGGKEDLLSSIIQSYNGYWFGFNSISTNRISVDIQYSKDPPADFLPQAGLELDPVEESDTEIVTEATLRDRTIIHFALSDSRDRHVISLHNLALFAESFQKTIKHIYKKVVSRSNEKALNSADNYTLNAFSYSPGSFKLHLESAGALNLFNKESEVARALEVFHKFIEAGSSESDDELVDILKDYSGHAISNLKSFLERIIERGIDVKYKWYTPGAHEVYGNIVNREYALRVRDLLVKREELSVTEKEFRGRVLMANEKNGSWALLDSENGEVKGRSTHPRLLTGVEIGQFYLFRCNEVIEEEEVSGKEIIRYELVGKELIG